MSTIQIVDKNEATRHINLEMTFCTKQVIYKGFVTIESFVWIEFHQGFAEVPLQEIGHFPNWESIPSPLQPCQEEDLRLQPARSCEIAFELTN